MSATRPPKSQLNVSSVPVNQGEQPKKEPLDSEHHPPDQLAQALSIGSSSPWPAWTMSGLLLASLPTSSRLATSLHPTGLAPTWQVAPLAMVFGLSGYITSVGDNYNGSGTASAWSFIYLFLYGRDSWKYTFSRPSKLRTSIFPISLTGLALTNGLIHGYVYWTGFYRDKLKDDLEQETTSKA